MALEPDDAYEFDLSLNQVALQSFAWRHWSWLALARSHRDAWCQVEGHAKAVGREVNLSVRLPLTGLPKMGDAMTRGMRRNGVVCSDPNLRKAQPSPCMFLLLRRDGSDGENLGLASQISDGWD